VVVALVACAGDDAGTDVTRPDGGEAVSPSSAAPDVPPDEGGPHECVPGDGRDVRIAWARLRNPVLQVDSMAKDQAVRWSDGQWHIWYSNRTAGDAEGRIVHAVSDDWLEWDTVAPAIEDAGSPDVTRLADGRFVMSHQAPAAPGVHRPVYRAAASAAELAAADARPLFADLFPGERLIDIAFAHADAGVFAMFKRGAREAVVQVPTLVHSPSGSLEGPWMHVGDPDVGLFENYQFLTIDGAWHLLGTRIPVHAPELYRLDGDASDPQAWLRWTPLGALDVPEEEWNGGGTIAGIDYERANSAYLCDARAVDGYFYLFYAGSTELATHAGRGHAKIGVARSADLVTWNVPPG